MSLEHKRRRHNKAGGAMLTGITSENTQGVPSTSHAFGEYVAIHTMHMWANSNKPAMYACAETIIQKDSAVWVWRIYQKPTVHS